MNEQDLENRLSTLEGHLRRSVGGDPPLVCRVCYSVENEIGCPCGRTDWMLLVVVIAELTLKLDDRKEHVESTFISAGDNVHIDS